MPIVICLLFMLLLVDPKLVIQYYYYYYYYYVRHLYLVACDRQTNDLWTQWFYSHTIYTFYILTKIKYKSHLHRWHMLQSLICTQILWVFKDFSAWMNFKGLFCLTSVVLTSKAFLSIAYLSIYEQAMFDKVQNRS
jgi:hypothetical protein